jgi:cell pole-organizing protein PopZ
MALQEPQAEPSMEEILASIRRIISEEEQTASEPVLELSSVEPPPVDEGDDIVFEALEPEPEAPPPAPAPEVRAAAPAPVELSPAPAAPAEPILSPPTATATAGALARLAGTLRIADTPNQTVEGVVRELLKPMLKEWLDRNLQSIVEARVEAELERIARMVR